jgi:hypothetical protein
MKKLPNFFIAASIVSSIFFSSLSVEAQEASNVTIAEKTLGDKTIKLIVFSRTSEIDAPPASNPAGEVQCNSNEVVTGGGFTLSEPSISDVVASNKVRNGWALSFVNFGDHATTGTVYAQCAHIEIAP